MRPSPKKRKARPLEDVSEHTEKGGLHRSLGIPEGEKIGEARIAAATHSKNKKTAAEARLAETYNRYRKGGKGRA